MNFTIRFILGLFFKMIFNKRIDKREIFANINIKLLIYFTNHMFQDSEGICASQTSCVEESKIQRKQESESTPEVEVSCRLILQTIFFLSIIHLPPSICAGV